MKKKCFKDYVKIRLDLLLITVAEYKAMNESAKEDIKKSAGCDAVTEESIVWKDEMLKKSRKLER